MSESVGTEPRSSPGVATRIKQTLLGAPRNLRDPSLKHHISLAAFLAWVGLGADGLSSSAYGPEEAFRALDDHIHLAIFLALATAFTVAVISYCYSRIIEQFPHGGGGYMVATTLLGPRAGVVSGAALLVDYVLTITVSIASGGDAVFSLLPSAWQPYKLTAEYAAIVVLILLNLRGVKESVTVLIPIFLTFVVLHAALIFGTLAWHIGELPAITGQITHGVRNDVATLGWIGLLVLMVRAYSFGAGTYTGIEAVSNGVAILREPRVETGKRTMLYMAVSLAITAAGLLVCYMLLAVKPVAGQTLNAVLVRTVCGAWRPGGVPLGPLLVFLTVGSEAVLLLVAAQTGFIDGPRVMANMARDSWLPRRFAALSDRLTTQNGIVLIGIAAMAILTYTRGHIGLLVVMYSINVFITFSMSELGMVRYWSRRFRVQRRSAGRDLAIHSTGLLLCSSILVIMLVEKFTAGGWVTGMVTLALILVCVAIRKHYDTVSSLIRDVDRTFANLPNLLRSANPAGAPDPAKPTAVILVGGYGGLGLHILMNVLRLFPESFHNVIFMSVGVVDSSFFSGDEGVTGVEERTRAALQQYVDVARRMGKAADLAYRLGTDVVEEAATLCAELSKTYSRCVFFAGTLAFDRAHWYDRILHNETAYAIQRRLKFDGLAMVIVPLLLRQATKPSAA
ncbi:MAG: APC family permease [Phycisphaerae bacterium]